MKLIAHVVDGHHVDIRPAPVERDWMEATTHRFAYRCLPLNIANAYGWEILCNAGFAAIWNGGPRIEDIEIFPDAGTSAPAISHFAHGILTFHLSCLFRTAPGFDLMAQGPINRPKDGIAALAGIIETDWVAHTFTMNWLFTRPGLAVRFDRGEPFCHIFPVRRGELEAIEPEYRMLSQEPELERRFTDWKASRNKFNTELKTSGSQAQTERWQKHYYRGVHADGEKPQSDDHRTRVRLRPFAK